MTQDKIITILRQTHFLREEKNEFNQQYTFWQKFEKRSFSASALEVFMATSFGCILVWPFSSLIATSVGGICILYFMAAIYATVKSQKMRKQIEQDTVNAFWSEETIKSLFLRIKESPALVHFHDYQPDFLLCLEALKNNNKEKIKIPLFRTLRVLLEEENYSKRYTAYQIQQNMVEKELSVHSDPFLTQQPVNPVGYLYQK